MNRLIDLMIRLTVFLIFIQCIRYKHKQYKKSLSWRLKRETI